MAKGKSEKKVAKGFGFYLLMFILLIFVAFFVIVAIMMFSPKTVILGYQYFYIGDEKALTSTTDKSETKIDFSETSKIEINCNNSRVSVVRDSKVEKDTVAIVAKANGFSKASDNVELDYSVVYDGKILKIDVTEPQGFLLFSNDLQIVIKSPVKSAYKFNNTTFDISTKSGNVVIGNTQDATKSENITDVNNLIIKTENGSVELGNGLEPTLDSLAIATGSGAINCKLDTLNLNRDTTLTTASGSIDLNKVALKTGAAVDGNKTLTLKLGNGSAKINQVEGSLSFVAGNANLNVEETVTGNLSANETADTIDSSQITVKKVNGNVSLPCLKNSNVTLEEVAGQINIETTSGNVNIGKDKSGITNKTSYIKTSSGTINAIIGYEDALAEHYFVTDSGNINLVYKANSIMTNHIESNSGNVDIKVASEYRFKLVLRNAKKELYKEMNDKLSLTFLPEIHFVNPMPINKYQGDTKILDVATDGNISVGLI